MNDSVEADIGNIGVDTHPLLEPVSDADFDAVDLNGLTRQLRRLDRHALSDLLWDEQKRADEGKEPAPQRVFRLLSMIMGLHLRVEAEGDTFGVQWQNDTRRTALPADFRGEQAEVLARLAPKIDHPALRARIADVAYEAGVVRAGRIALEAYCEVAVRLADGRAEVEFPDIGSRAMDAVKPIERCFMINARIAKRGTYPEPLAGTLNVAFTAALAERAYFPVARLGRRLLRTSIVAAEEVAEAAETLANSAVPEDYRLAVKEVWLLAADARAEAGDEETSRAASIKAIEQTLAMTDTVGSSSAKAHWVKEALREFRGRGDCKDRVAALRATLRELQDCALDEFGVHAVQLDGIAELRVQTFEQFKALDLPAALRSMVGFLIPDDVEQLKEEVLKQSREFPLSNLMSSSYADKEGREVARGPSFDFDGEPSEAWFKEHGIRHLAILRRYRVHGNIEPARQAVLERFSISEEHMLPIVQISSFVPTGHQHIFALGLARLWQGDYVTAGHLLLPQIENSLRYVLHLSGRDTSKIEENGLEGDRPLNVLLSHCRADLEAVFGANMVWELDTLLNFRPGPALRHELAHGKLDWGSFFSDEAITACWLAYVLTVAPLLPYWDSQVAPGLNATSGAAQA